YATTAADQAIAGKAITGAILVAAILFMPDGILGRMRATKRVRIDAESSPPLVAPPVASDRRPSARAAPLLLVRGLRKHFRGVRALDGVDLDVRDGEILGVLGPNGSGKSTLINVVSGHYAADAGSVRFDGRELARLPAHR